MQLKPEVLMIYPPGGKLLDVLHAIQVALFKKMDGGWMTQLMPNGKDIVILVDCGEDRAKWGEIRDKVEKETNKAIKNLGLDFESCPGIWKE